MPDSIPELVYRSAKKTVARFCLEPVERSGQEYYFTVESISDGFEISILPTGQKDHFALARLLYSPDLEQWTLHRSRDDDRWSYVPEAGGSLDLNRLLAYLRDDPLNIFRY